MPWFKTVKQIEDEDRYKEFLQTCAAYRESSPDKLPITRKIRTASKSWLDRWGKRK